MSDDLRAKYGADKVPTHINAHAYDTVLLVAEAVRRGATDAESMRDRLSKMKDIEVTTGKITFDAKGQNNNIKGTALQNLKRKPMVVLPKDAAEAELTFPQPGWNDKRRT